MSSDDPIVDKIKTHTTNVADRLDTASTQAIRHAEAGLHQATDGAQRAQEKIKERWHDVSAQAQEKAHQLKEKAVSAKANTEGKIQAHPWKAVALALGAGAALTALLKMKKRS